VRIALLALHFAEYASRLAVALPAEHEVLLVLHTSNANDELTADLRHQLEESVDVRYVGIRRRRDPRVLGTSFAINRILRRFSPDVLHVQELDPVLGGWTMLSVRKAVPVVVTVHDPVVHSGTVFLPEHGFKWRSILWFRRRASRLIVHGPRMRAELQALDPSLAERVDIIPHGWLGQASVNEDPGGSEPATFLFFGRIESYKGLSYLLDAAEILQRRGRHLKVVVAGIGKDLERHRERIAASAWVELIDRYVASTDVADLFRRSTAVVLPYTDATQSGVAAIAFANSRPVIATAVGDLPDVVIHGRTGLIVPPRDGEGLADAMESLLNDPGLCHSLAVGAGQYAKEKLSWSRIAELAARTYRCAIESYRVRGAGRFSLVDE